MFSLYTNWSTLMLRTRNQNIANSPGTLCQGTRGSPAPIKECDHRQSVEFAQLGPTGGGGVGCSM